MHFLLQTLKKIYSIVQKRERYKPSCSPLDAQETSNIIRYLLEREEPCMIGRFGSTELSCICNYISIKSEAHSYIKYIQGLESEWWWNENIINQMARWSGFFPSTAKNCSRFCELMLDDARYLDMLGKWTFGEERMTPYLGDVYNTHLIFLEPFWCETPWTKSLEGKKIVVVHPFSELIEKQYKEHRTDLFTNKNILPSFELRTVKAVQSLGGESDSFEDWFEALEWMKLQIEKQDYDICLLGCGAYGFPLAAHIKRQGKKAIHLGGALQLLFGIIGARWENPMYGVKEWDIAPNSYSSLINSFWVHPEEKYRPKNSQDVEGGCYW